MTTGSDSGFIYKLYGFDYIREFELLQEAGFHPLEVIRAATMHGAQLLHEPTGKRIEFGIIKPGLLADLVIVPENPVANLKVLYGTGAIRLNDQNSQPERVGVDLPIRLRQNWRAEMRSSLTDPQTPKAARSAGARGALKTIC